MATIDYTIPQYPTSRLRYFNNQFLVAQDFIDEQAATVGRERVALRSLCVAGVLDDIPFSNLTPAKFQLGPGTAVDRYGRLIALEGAIDGPLPGGVAPGDYVVSLAWSEVEDKMATAGSGGAPGNTRFVTRPVVTLVATGTALPDGAIAIGAASVATGGVFVAGSPTAAGREYSGLRLPGTSATLARAPGVNTGATADGATLFGTLALRRDIGAGQLGPILALTTTAGGAGAGGAIDFSGYDVGGNDPALRLQSLDDGNASSHLVVRTKKPGAHGNGLIERLRLTSDGVLKFPNNTLPDDPLPKDKLVIWETSATDRYGLGMNSSNLNLFCPAGAHFSLRQNSSAGTEVFSVTGTGAGTLAGNLRVGGVVSWGDSDTRTEDRNDAGLQGDAGARSGFFQTMTPANFPPVASNWWHLLDVRHSNPANNYALQIAGSFFDQGLWFRKTNNCATTAWSQFIGADAHGNVVISNNLSVYASLLCGQALTVDGDITCGGAKISGVSIGIQDWSGSLKYPYETIGLTSPAFNLRLHSHNNIFLEANNISLDANSISLDAPSSVYTGKFGKLEPSSDSALKRGVRDLDGVLAGVMRLRPVRFGGKHDDMEDLGFIAQDFEVEFPEAVFGNASHAVADSALKALSTHHLAVIAIAAVRELKAEYDVRLEALEHKLAMQGVKS
jgi:hypothetical protein